MEGEKEGEKHQCVVASHMAPTGDLACNPGMCPDWELNCRPFDSQNNPIRCYYIIFKTIFFWFYLFIFREKGKEGEREGEKHQCVIASQTPSTGNLAHNPGMCPDWELNWWPFGSQAHAQSTELHQPGLIFN